MRTLKVSDETMTQLDSIVVQLASSASVPAQGKEGNSYQQRHGRSQCTCAGSCKGSCKTSCKGVFMY